MKTTLQILLMFVVGIAAALCLSAAAHAGVVHSAHGMARPDRWALIKSKTPFVPTVVSTSLGAGDVNSNCGHAPIGNTLRIIVDYYSPIDRRLGCAQEASRAHLRILLVIQYANLWTDTEITQRFKDALALYTPLHPYSVSVGNEQELRMSDGCYCLKRTTLQMAADYSRIWKNVEPLIANIHAVPVAGEISPWGFAFLVDALKDGLPGAKVLAGHLYPAQGGGATPLAMATLAQSHDYQAWATEGMCGPNAWMQYGCITADVLHKNGFSIGMEWFYNGTQPPPILIPPHNGTHIGTR